MVAMLHNPMRIGPAADEAKEADRRIFPRRTARGVALTRRLDHAVDSRQNPQVTMIMRDISLGGISALSDLPLNRGERLSLRLPTEGMGRSLSAFGRVVRCEMSGMGYRVAVEFDPMPSAA